jgi:hypothetical protein
MTAKMAAKGNWRGRWWPLRTEQMTTEVVRAQLRHSAERRRVVMQLGRADPEAPVRMPRQRWDKLSRIYMTLTMRAHRCVRVLKERGEVLSVADAAAAADFGIVEGEVRPESHTDESQTPPSK